LGSDIIMQTPGQPEEQRLALENALSQTFRPEFLNRVDEVVIFQPLTPEEIRQIVTLQITEVEKRLKPKNIELSVSEAAIDHFAATGYDLVFGARPLKRLIQNTLLNELSTLLIEGKVKEGDTVRVEFDGKKLKVGKK
jgi:ATP-dependent Clp protease ATP-binding subunit ClpA